MESKQAKKPRKPRTTVADMKKLLDTESKGRADALNSYGKAVEEVTNLRFSVMKEKILLVDALIGFVVDTLKLPYDVITNRIEVIKDFKKENQP